MRIEKISEYYDCNIFFLLRCVCETQMTPMMANSKDGQDHKDEDKYFFLPGERLIMCNMEDLVFII